MCGATEAGGRDEKEKGSKIGTFGDVVVFR